MLLLFESSGLCVQSSSIIPFPGYPQCHVPHLRLFRPIFTPRCILLSTFYFLHLCVLVLAIWIIEPFRRKHNYAGCIILIIGVFITCLEMVLTHTTFVMKTKLAKLTFLQLAYIRCLLFASLLTIFGRCFPPLGYLHSSHLLSGSKLNHLMHSKDAECTLMFLCAIQRGVPVAHIYVLKLPLHHL